MIARETCNIPFRSPSGATVAHVTIVSERFVSESEPPPILEIDELEAREHGETSVQLRETERYEYEVRAEGGGDLRLRSHLATRRRSLAPGLPDAGRIETGNWCGTLLLELVEGEVDAGKTAVGLALIDVRSVKLNYRREYRGMLRRISDRLAGLVVDARASTKVGFRSSFQERSHRGWLQVQLELLREVLESTDFSAALQRIVTYPNERLSVIRESCPSAQQIRWTPSALRQLVTGNPRKPLPPSHPLRQRAGLNSVAEKVLVTRKTRDVDTPENRFVKYALRTFVAFLSHAEEVFEGREPWTGSAALARRLSALVEDWLARDLFQEVEELCNVPLGSPVLQRKAGYREVLRWWLRFHTAAELSWEGGEELFRAGQRDVATLYEYWLFFELLDWFCTKCNAGNRPPIEELVDGLDDTSPMLKLRRSKQLGPFVGTFASGSRRLIARFAYNRRFEVTPERYRGGSWTKRMHPDYTFTFWPDGMSEADAERRELLVHIHFDAKYRVEGVEELFGTDSDEAPEDGTNPTYKRADLLKMHAYRDAIKRSQGAYVLYPGGRKSPEIFSGFHEILPGLGAFAVSPEENGAPHGIKDLERFLDSVLDHLVNRTTALERVSYHLAEAYTVAEDPVPYGSPILPEADVYGPEYRALPLAEQMVLLAWYRTEAQCELAQSEKGFTYIRLGSRRGSFHVHPNLARVRHLVLRTDGGVVAPGLLRLREPGFRVYTRSQLRTELQKCARAAGIAAWATQAGADDDDIIYALFQTTADLQFMGQQWKGEELMGLIERFEQDARNKPVNNLGRRSPDPRIIPLRELLKVRATHG